MHSMRTRTLWSVERGSVLRVVSAVYFPSRTCLQQLRTLCSSPRPCRQPLYAGRRNWRRMLRFGIRSASVKATEMKEKMSASSTRNQSRQHARSRCDAEHGQFGCLHLILQCKVVLEFFIVVCASLLCRCAL